jgi:pimeloyl-ACP methyl ester carboxylesterase
MMRMANIVLIHGSWHGAWCWHKVEPRLRALGHRVIVPDLPGHGREPRALKGRITLGAMVSHVERAIDAVDGPVCVVAHSRGGIVASTLAERRPDRVSRLVYLASYMLVDGQRVADLFEADTASLVTRHLRIDRWTVTDALAAEGFREALYADCAEDDIALAHALLTPEPSLPALTRVRLTPERYGSVPRTYIALTQDRAVTPGLQRRLYEAQPVEQVLEIDASHSAYFSKPDELTRAIDSVAH